MTGTKDISFTKMTGTGNDFIVFDNRKAFFSGEETDFFARVCRRRVSVGADGVLLVEEGQSAPVRMRYFNSDGREAAMCGNGARCAGFFARAKKCVDADTFLLEASDGVHLLRVNGNEVSLKMRKPEGFRSGYGILRESGFVEGGFVDTGVPHYVIFVQDVDEVAVEKVAPFYRDHRVFPQGVNVDFVERTGEDRIRVRTYERGVEGETLSCGTGCVASTLFAARTFGYRSPVTVVTRGGDLTVGFDDALEDVFLTGRVEIVYEGVLPMTLETG